MNPRLSPSFLSLGVGQRSPQQVGLLFVLWTLLPLPSVCAPEPLCGTCSLVLYRETEARVEVGPAFQGYSAADPH